MVAELISISGRILSTLAAVSVVLTFSAESSEAAVHPGHVSRAEIEWNAETGRFEVALSVRAVDAEEWLSVTVGRRVSLETDRQADELLQKLVRKHFHVGRRGAQEHWRWAGHELHLHEVWVYFEVVPGIDHRPGNRGSGDVSDSDTQSGQHPDDGPKSAHRPEDSSKTGDTASHKGVLPDLLELRNKLPWITAAADQVDPAEPLAQVELTIGSHRSSFHLSRENQDTLVRSADLKISEVSSVSSEQRSSGM